MKERFNLKMASRLDYKIHQINLYGHSSVFFTTLFLIFTFFFSRSILILLIF